MTSKFYVNVNFSNLDSKDLNMYYCGHRKNFPGHSYGPAIRDHHLLVYVANGHGRYEINGKVFSLSSKSIFVVFPDCKVYYQADEQDPWENVWIGLYGNLLDKYMEYLGLNPSNPVYIPKEPNRLENLLLELVSQVQESASHLEINCIGLLYQVFSALLRDCQEENCHPSFLPSKEKYIESAKNFIKFNYNRNISCSDIAKHVNLDRSYFSKLFKEGCGLSPSEYLIRSRMEKASALLQKTDLSIEDIAYSVGIKDPFYFSRSFKKYFTVSPQAYRKNFNPLPRHL